jgi:antitoxin VapB
MALNIKDEEAHRLARELARATGESMTVAVCQAIRERLDRIRENSRKDRVERILEIGRECAAHLKKLTNLWTMESCCMTRKVYRNDSGLISIAELRAR